MDNLEYLTNLKIASGDIWLKFLNLIKNYNPTDNNWWFMVDSTVKELKDKYKNDELSFYAMDYIICIHNELRRRAIGDEIDTLYYEALEAIETTRKPYEDEFWEELIENLNKSVKRHRKKIFKKIATDLARERMESITKQWEKCKDNK